MKKLSVLWDLFVTFLKIGLFTFGGGYAMISVIEDICVTRKRWITHEEMMNMTVIAESTPGPIAINCATYVGCQKAALAGATAATLGVVLPSFVIIYLISTVLDNFLEITVIANAFRGIQVGVSLLILSVGISMAEKAERGLPRVIMVCAFTAMLLINLFAWNVSTITLMLLGGLVSLSVFAIKKGGEGK